MLSSPKMSNYEELMDCSGVLSDQLSHDNPLKNDSFIHRICEDFENRPPLMHNISHFLYGQPSLTLFGYVNPLSKPQFNHLVDDRSSCILRTQAFRKTWAHLSCFIERHIIQTIVPGINKALKFINNFSCASFLELPTILSLAGTNTADHDYVFSILAKACEKEIIGGKFAVLNAKRCASVASAITQMYRQFAGLEEIEQQEVASYATGVATDSDNDVQFRIGNDVMMQNGVTDMSYIARVALSPKVYRSVTPEQLCEWYQEEKIRRKKLDYNAKISSKSNKNSKKLFNIKTPYMRTRKKIYNSKSTEISVSFSNNYEFPLVVLIEGAECFPPTILGGILEIASHLRYDEGLPLAFVLGVSTSTRFIESLCEPETYRKLYIQAVELYNSKNICEGFLTELLLDPTLLPFSINSTAVKALYDIFNQQNKCIASLIKAVYQICHDFYNEKIFSFLARPFSDLCSDFTNTNSVINIGCVTELSKVTCLEATYDQSDVKESHKPTDFCVKWNSSFSVSNLYQKLILLSIGSELKTEHFDYLVSKYKHLDNGREEKSSTDSNFITCDPNEEQHCISQKWLQVNPLKLIMEPFVDSSNNLEYRNKLLCFKILPKAMLELNERHLGFFIGLRILDETREGANMITKIKRIAELMSKAEALQTDLTSRKLKSDVSYRSAAMKKVYTTQNYFQHEINVVCLKFREKIKREGFGYLSATLSNIYKTASQIFPLLNQLEIFLLKLEENEKVKNAPNSNDLDVISNSFLKSKQASKNEDKEQTKTKLQLLNKSNVQNFIDSNIQCQTQESSYLNLFNALTSMIDRLNEMKKFSNPALVNTAILNNINAKKTSFWQEKKILSQDFPVCEFIDSNFDTELSAVHKMSFSSPTVKMNNSSSLNLEILCDDAINWLNKCLTKLIIPLPQAHPLAGDLIMWGKSSTIGTWLENNLYYLSIKKILTEMVLCQQKKAGGKNPVFKCECCTVIDSNVSLIEVRNDAMKEFHNPKRKKVTKSSSLHGVNDRCDILPSMEDLTVMYRLYERSGRLIDLWDWFCAFCSEILKPHDRSSKGQHDSFFSLARQTNVLQHLRLRFGLAVGTLAVIFSIIKIPNCVNFSEQHNMCWDKDGENEFSGNEKYSTKTHNICLHSISFDKTPTKNMCQAAKMMKQELQGNSVKKFLWGKVWYCGEFVEKEIFKFQINGSKSEKKNIFKKV